MKKHDLQIDGQINLFDLLESVENTPSDINPKMETSWDDMTEDELFEEIIKECDLKKYKVEEEEYPFDLDEKDIRIKKRLIFKINQVDFKIGPFSNYQEDIRDGRRFVSCDYDYKKGGGGTPAESIAEVIDFIRRQSKNGKQAKAAEQEEKITLPLSHHYCYVIGSNCACMTEKGCLYPYKCGLMKESVESVNEERKEKEQETATEDIETIEEKVRSWVGEDFLPYIVAQIIKNKSWLLENIRQIEYKDLEDYGKPLRDLFTEHVYKFMVADTEFELTKAPYDTTIYFIQCQKIKNEHGYVLTLANILSKEIVLELMKQPRPVHIKGICDDAYCPECNYALDELKELDCEKCPICGALIDWTPWHIKNDKETEDEKVNN